MSEILPIIRENIIFSFELREKVRENNKISGKTLGKLKYNTFVTLSLLKQRKLMLLVVLLFLDIYFSPGESQDYTNLSGGNVIEYFFSFGPFCNLVPII